MLEFEETVLGKEVHHMYGNKNKYCRWGAFIMGRHSLMGLQTLLRECTKSGLPTGRGELLVISEEIEWIRFLKRGQDFFLLKQLK